MVKMNPKNNPFAGLLSYFSFLTPLLELPSWMWAEMDKPVQDTQKV